MATLNIFPTGVGNSSNLSFTGDTPAWKCVDDPNIPPSNDDADYVYESSGTAYDTYQMTDHSSENGDISNVRVYIRAKKLSSGSETARAVLRSGGTDYFGVAAINFAWNYYYVDWAQNPADSEDWEWADIDALEAGVELTWISSNGPRCTQVYVEITYTNVGTSDRDISVVVNVSSAINISVDIEALSMSDRSVSVDISANILELCYYDTGNNRWTDGSYGGARVRVIDKVIKLQKSEELNKLSVLKFDIFSYDENWEIEEGAIISLGRDFKWSGTPGASASEFLTGFLFQGQVTKVEKSSPNPEGVYDLKVEAVYSINTLYNQYVNYLITVIRAYRGGDEKLCTSAYHLKELVGDVTYYDETGTADDLPVYIRRDNEYIKHREYIDKNKLEIFLDICNSSQNVFYCHNEKFYFEPKKPILMATYYQKPSWEQNYNIINYDSTYKHRYDEPLIGNNYDLIGSNWKQHTYVYATFRNTSPYSQDVRGASFWAGKFKNGAQLQSFNYFTMTDGRTISTGIGVGSGSWLPSSTTDIELCHNINPLTGTLSANTAYVLGFTMGQTATYEIEYGTQYPSRIFYPFALRVTDGSPKNIWRSTFTLPVHIFAADQIRYFEPSIPPRFIVYKDGTQLDQWYNQGWNPEIGSHCFSGFVHDTGLWNILDWSSYPHHFLLPRDYNVISDMSGVTNENAGIYEDTALRDWYNETQEIEVEFDFTDTIDIFNTTDDQELAVAFAFDWDGNGLKDHILTNIIGNASGTDVKFIRVSNDSPTTVNTHNYSSSHDQYISKMKIGIKFADNTTYMKVQGYCNNDTTWEGSSWIDMGVGDREGEGIGLRIVKLIDIGIKYFTIREVYGIDAELDNNLVTSIKKKDKGRSAQYVVIGEKSIMSGSRVPFAKYPDEPDGSGPIVVKKLKIYSDDAAKTAAQYLYEADAGESIDVEIYDLFDVYPNEFLRPNKQIKIDSNYYYIDKMVFDITQNVQKIKLKGGSSEVGFYEYLAIIQDKKEEKKGQAKVNAPLYYEFEMDEDLRADEILDNTPYEKPTLPTAGGDHYFTRD